MVYFCKSLVSPIEQHPFHEHKLFFCNIDNGWICNCPEEIGCRRNVKKEYQSYSIPRFRCSLCDFDLCDLCAKYRTHSYSGHPWHPHPMYRCYVKNGWMCEGRLMEGGCRSFCIDFNQTGNMNRYRCDICDFDLCIRCMLAGIPDFVDLDEKKIEGDQIEMESPNVNFENIDNNELMKFFDKSVFLEPFTNTSLSVEEEEETMKKYEEEKVEKPVVIEKPSDDSLCSLCCEKTKSVALIHSKMKTSHILCCEECSTKLDYCPICREPIDHVVKYVYVN